jgi:hypothetical protein
MKAQEVSNSLWGLATLGGQPRDESVRQGLEAASLRHCPSMNSQNVANTLWAMATLKWQPTTHGLHEGLEGAALRQSPSMGPQDVANTLWGMATLAWQLTDSSLRDALEDAALRLCPTMNSQCLGNILWSMAVLGWDAREQMSTALNGSISRLCEDNASIDSRQLHQLFQAHLASQQLGSGRILLPPAILKMASREVQDVALKTRTSIMQCEVMDSLGRLGYAHEVEYVTADGFFSIDIAIAASKIAIEIDGPSHFTANTLEPLGHTRFRDRLLSAMGWRVIAIPYFEWGKLHEGFHVKDAYIAQLIGGMHVS